MKEVTAGLQRHQKEEGGQRLPRGSAKARDDSWKRSRLFCRQMERVKTVQAQGTVEANESVLSTGAGEEMRTQGQARTRPERGRASVGPRWSSLTYPPDDWTADRGLGREQQWSKGDVRKITVAALGRMGWRREILVTETPASNCGRTKAGK